MKVFKINLLNEATEYGFMPTLTANIIEGNPKERELRPAILIAPGGGYAYVTAREGERVALAFACAGFHTFVLDYCCSPHTHPMPLLNIAKAISIIRENATEWEIAENKIAVCGFSAGGHLAASISTLWNDKEVFYDDEEKNRLHRPDATILSYPVISSGEFSHAPSFARLTGSENKNLLWDKLSCEKQVNHDTPPAFLWHTYGDSGVPLENSMLYASALRKFNIPFELHIYPDGGHGMSLVTDETFWKVNKFTREYPWVKQAIEWLYLRFGITELKNF